MATEASLTNVFDAVLQFPTFFLNSILYVLSCFADLFLSVLDLVYSFIATIVNIILCVLNFLPNVMESYFGWLFELSPTFEVFFYVSIYLLYIIVSLRLVKLLWDLLPIA